MTETITGTIPGHEIRFTLTPDKAAQLIAQLANAIARGEDADLHIQTGPTRMGDTLSWKDCPKQVARIGSASSMVMLVGSLIWSGIVDSNKTVIHYDAREVS